MNFWSDLTEPYEFERKYFSWRTQTTKELSKNVGKYLENTGISLTDIKKEIKLAVKGGILTPSEDYILEINNQELFDFFKEYVNAWYKHDSSAFEHSNLILSSSNMNPSLLTNFLDNDKRVMAYTLNLPNKIEQLGKKILRVGRDSNLSGLVYCPLRTFEHSLSDVCRETGLNFNDLSNLFYQDFDKTEKLFSLEETKISLQNGETPQSIRKTISENFNQIPDLRLLFRMTFWSNYDECRRRFFIEFGVVDYLYRKKLFEEYKGKIPNGKTCLNMKLEDIQK